MEPIAGTNRRLRFLLEKRRKEEEGLKRMRKSVNKKRHERERKAYPKMEKRGENSEGRKKI